MSVEFENHFTIMPKDTNYMFPMVFGGAFFSEMDLTAANCVKKCLQKSENKNLKAVTHKANVCWLKPTWLGDIVKMKAEVVSLGKKSIVVKVLAFIDDNNVVAEAEFVFVSLTIEPMSKICNYCNHNLKMEDL